MKTDEKDVRELCGAFLREWPIERLRRMTIEEYSQAGASNTFTSWIESRLDKAGSIWGGSSFKFGVFSRNDHSEKKSGPAGAYTHDYGWYPKYGPSPDSAFDTIRSRIVQIAEAASRGDYAAIDPVDLGTSYKWKIAFHYQNRSKYGVVAVFKKDWLKRWLKSKGEVPPDEMSELYGRILALRPVRTLEEALALAREVWTEGGPEEDAAVPEGGEAALEEADRSRPLNLVLYGPPGTGKTYLTAELAVKICDGVVPDGRAALMTRYRELRNLRRIRFVTFHPSFTYEEFVEGIRPTTVNGQVRYEVRPGVFKQAAAYARELFEKREMPRRPLDLSKKTLFKMSLGDTSKREEEWIYPDCVENGYVCLGYAPGIDFSGADTRQAVKERFRSAKPDAGETDFSVPSMNMFKNELQKGDLVLISDGNTRFRAIAEVTGPYQYEPREAGYDHRRAVRWLWTVTESVPIDAVFAKKLSQLSVYRMDQDAVRWPALEELLNPRQSGGAAPSCVIIIDEINRANLAKTFGELITLLEPSKRLGEPDEQEAELPYSGERICVPPNLYVIGTMNTADRSIALMDTALRRRFAFQELTPMAALLSEDVEGINLRKLLAAMNLRIETLFDRDHVLGHTYLMGVSSFRELAERFRGQVIPLLQEYFFEDWRRIQEVLNDVDQKPELQIIQSLSGGQDETLAGDRRRRYRVNPEITPGAIQKIYE